jgi:stringent starvation protein B
MRKMSSNRPYLLRALYEWITDNGMTPLILVKADLADTHVPAAYIEDGRIVLNISMSAVQGLELGNEFVRFHARFAGVVEAVQIPVNAIQAIYARENNMGMLLPDDPVSKGVAGEDEPAGKDDNVETARPTLRVVK